jgi:NAD(P)-dependent dehydrogenase (short-subunit alcohol dehydrogenase family)
MFTVGALVAAVHDHAVDRAPGGAAGGRPATAGSPLSRSPAPVGEHHVVDVTSPAFPAVLAEVGDVDLCVYAAGVGEPLTDDLAAQTRALEVNLLGAARMFEVLVPRMLAAGRPLPKPAGPDNGRGPHSARLAIA